MDQPTPTPPIDPARRRLLAAGACHLVAFAAGAFGLVVAADAGPRSLALMVPALLAVHSAVWFASVFMTPATPSATGDDRFRPLLAALDRIASALEKAPPPAVAVPVEPPIPTLADARLALAEREWGRVEAILAAHPDHPHAGILREELAGAKRIVSDELRERLDAAREANDPERVLELHADLTAVLLPDSVKELDGELARWFMKLMMRRMRTGTVRADVADLAWRVSERFGSTVEGASLRASLPTLRRSAGLCPRCGKPYAGLGDACPACLVGSNLPVPTGDEPDPDADPVERPDELGLD